MPAAAPPPVPPPVPAAAPGLSRTQRRWRAWLVAGLVLLLVALAAAWWRTRPVPVDALVLQPQPLQRTLQFSARVLTPARVEVGSTLTGRVASVPVREGDSVAAGAALVALEAEELTATWLQAQATLRQAQARLASQRAVASPGADAALRQAQATLATAERELQRTRELVAQGFVSSARLDEVQRNVDVASAQRDAAQAQARANRPDGSELAALEAQRQAAEAAVQVASARRDQTTLRAPAAGRVIARSVEPGQIVQPGRVLLTLTVTGPTELIAQVDERFLGQLRVGQSARVLADAYPLQAFDAVLARVAPGVDAARGAVEVVFTPVGEPPAFLREDMTLSVEAITGESAQALVLPLSALRTRAGPAASAQEGQVLVLEDGRARERSVTLGLRTLDQAEVTAGVVAGDTVLLDPRLVPGARVTPRAAR